MGMHTARRSGAMTSVAGRGLFTATAALALLGGGAGMAFAGEAPSHSEHDGDHHGKHDGDHHGEHAAHHGKPASCEIPIVDPTVKTTEGAVNEATHDATKPVFEAGTEATAPVHDAICPPARDILGPLAGEA